MNPSANPRLLKVAVTVNFISGTGNNCRLFFGGIQIDNFIGDLSPDRPAATIFSGC